MNFAQPALAAAALACAALPFLLHLLLRRPRATEWPSTMLLQRAIEKLRRRRRVERWLLLVTRSLALLLAGLAMAGPLMRSSAWQVRERWIVIDDGATAAERLSDGRPAMEWIREQVIAALQDLHEGDRVALVSAAQPAHVLLSPTMDIQRALREVGAMQIHPVPGRWKEAIELALPTADDRMDLARELMLAGSFRRGSVDPETPLPSTWKDRLSRIRRWCTPPPVGGSPDRWLGDIRVGRSTTDAAVSAQVPVRVQLMRTGRGTMIDPVTVQSVRGETIGRADASWSADATETRVEVAVRPTEGDAVRVQVSPDAQPLNDVTVVASLPVREPAVLVLGRRAADADLERLPSSAWVTRALESAGLRPQEVDPSTLALRSARDVDAVVACRPDLLDAAGWQWLSGFGRDGGTILFMPVPEIPAQAWQLELARILGRTSVMAETAEEGTFRLAPRQPRSLVLSLLGAELDALAEPVTVVRRWSLTAGTEQTEALRFTDGSPAMTVTQLRGGGVVALLATATDLACTDLPLKPMMVPLLQEVVRGGRWVASTSQRTLSGERASLGPSAAGGLLEPSDASQGAAIELDAEGETIRALPAPGLWKLRMRDGRERWIAVSLDPAAARIDPVTPEALETWRGGLAPWQSGAEGSSTTEASTGSAWTPWLFAVVLVLLLLEVPLSRHGSPRRMEEMAA